METSGNIQGENNCRSGSNGASDSKSESESDDESGDHSGDDSEGEKQEQNKADAEKGGVSAARPSPLNTPVRNVGDREY